jgi:hypothetical protein
MHRLPSLVSSSGPAILAGRIGFAKQCFASPAATTDAHLSYRPVAC